MPSILIVNKGSHCVVFDGMDEKRKSAKIFETTNNEIRFVDVTELRPGPAKPLSVTALVHRGLHFLHLLFCRINNRRARGMPAVRRRTSPGRQRAGFTAIELLLAIAIVGSLMAIVLPSIQQAPG